MRDLHMQVRVVYRVCRRLYGVERTQDECLKVFKVVFPQMQSLLESDDERASVPEETARKVERIFKHWRPGGALKELCDRVMSLLWLPCDWRREELIQFYWDILPVAMRVRKLTPREAFRLMDVDEGDIDTLLNSGVSDTWLYQLAGNSICVCCLEHIFKKLFVDTEPEWEYGKQLSLF